MFSEHNRIKLEINRKTWKIHKYLEIKENISDQPMSLSGTPEGC